VTDVISATGATLELVLLQRQHQLASGLTPQAYAKFHTALSRTPWGRLHQRTVALQRHGAVAASAECYALQAIVDERPVTMCGIGAVCGTESADDADAVQALVAHLTADAAARGESWTLLFPSPATTGVTFDGFREWPTTEHTLRVIESTRYGAPMATVRGGEERDLTAIVAMGRLAAAAYRCHLDRDVDFVRYVLARQRLLGGLGAAHERQLHFFIAEEGITAAAYVVISLVGDNWTIEACGDRDPSGARVGALLQAMIAREPSRPRPLIRAWLPAGFRPPQIEVVSSVPAVDAVRLRSRDEALSTLSGETMLYWRNDVL
jgi:hypothetical protein